MFNQADLDPIFDQFHKDMAQINEDHQNRLQQIKRRALIGRCVGLGLVFVGAAIAANQNKK
jgi:hypothetical protein